SGPVAGRISVCRVHDTKHIVPKGSAERRARNPRQPWRAPGARAPHPAPAEGEPPASAVESSSEVGGRGTRLSLSAKARAWRALLREVLAVLAPGSASRLRQG